MEICDLARACALSEAHFRKLFKKIHGVSPIRYVIDLRVDFASHLLQSGLYTVSEVAEKSGFADPKYFSRVFKARFGLTPKEYQQRHEGGVIIDDGEKRM